jgi:hypothetical protein
MIEARGSAHPRCFVQLADRLGFTYFSACNDVNGYGICPGKITPPMSTSNI